MAKLYKFKSESEKEYKDIIERYDDNGDRVVVS